MTHSHDRAVTGTGRTDRLSSVESALAGLWRQLLGATRVDGDSDFFALGGDSFRATQLATRASRRFGADLPVTLAFDRPTLGGQAALIASVAPAAATTGTEPASGRDEIALSTQQLEFLDWMAATEPPRDPGAVCTAVRIHEPFDAALLRRALDEITLRHEPLRTVCTREADGTLRLAVAASLPSRVEVVDAVGATPAEREQHAAGLARAERNRIGDLAADPLVRALVVRLAGDDFVLVLGVHHFVFDGWSLGVLLRELGLLYSAFRHGQGSPLRPLAQDHADYCAWTATEWDRNRPYWEHALAGAPRALVPFPGRTRTHRFSRRRHPFTAPAELWGRLRTAAQHQGCTAFMGAAACWTQVLAEWSGAEDIVLMSPVPGRTAPEHDALIGCLVQSLLLRVDASGRPGFAEQLARVRATLLQAAAHQFHAYHETAPKVPYPARIHYESWGGSPFFPGLRSEAYALPREQEELDWPSPGGEFDLSTPELIAEEQPDGSLDAAVVYNHHAFAPDTAAALARAFMAQVVAAAEPENAHA
ncbi:condensation domain-containing protein [Streptomyces sp. NPDC048623]|uniref:condensation domain-containing protein n=1 Tax=Streptomyces sp. NPDC048623 TaxID=3155761 RepID=UPI00341CB1E5